MTTRAPMALAICTTIEPTPPVPPLTNKISPGLQLGVAHEAEVAVSDTSAQAAAVSSLTPAGVG